MFINIYFSIYKYILKSENPHLSIGKPKFVSERKGNQKYLILIA